jgi:hypothetical protein
MKPLITLLTVTLAIGAGSSVALAQHGHGGGGGHMDIPGDRDRDHSQQMGTHVPEGASIHNPADRLAHNTALAAKLQLLLPGTNLQNAASGFKNLGQFVAAVHAAHNLHIPFDQLRAKMTGPNAESLGHAIRDLEPSLSPQTVKSDVKTAKRQAQEDLEASEANEKE